MGGINFLILSAPPRRQSEREPLGDGLSGKKRSGKGRQSLCHSSPLLPRFSGDRSVIIINISQHLFTNRRNESSGLFFFSPHIPCLSSRSHNPVQRSRAFVTCSIWAFPPYEACNKRMKCSFPALPPCSPACDELDSQPECLPLPSPFITNNQLILPCESKSFWLHPGFSNRAS